jgi:tetratricopeptide (TPR) repeat protein
MKRHSLSVSPRVVFFLCVIALSSFFSAQDGCAQNTQFKINTNDSQLPEFENLKTLLALLQQTEEYGPTRFTADIHSRIGKIFEINGLYSQALSHYSNAYTIYSSYSQSDKEALNGSLWTLYDIGNIFYRLKQYENAISMYKKTALLFFNKGDFYGIASSFSNIGLCYSNWNKPDSALQYYEKALEIRLQLNEPGIVSFSLNQIGNLYQSQNMFNEALDAFKKAIVIEKKHNSHNELIITYLNISEVFYSLNAKDSAAFYLDLSLQQGTMLQHNEYLVYIYSEFSRRSVLEGKIADSEKHLTNAVALAEKTGIIPLKSSIYHQYYLFAHDIGDYQTALDYLIKYNKQEELLRNQKTEEKLKQMEFLIMSEQLQSKIKSIEKENYINRLQNKNKSNILYYFILSSFILLLFALGNIRKMNFRFKLIGDLISDYSILQYAGVGIISLIYFTSFISLFTPFGLEECNAKPDTAFLIISGIIFTANLIFWISIISFLEKKISSSLYFKHRFLAISVCIILSTATSLFIYYISLETLFFSFYNYFSLILFTFIAYILPVYGIIIVAEKFLLKKHVAEARKLSQHFKNNMQEPSSGEITLRSILTKEELSLDIIQLLYIEAQGNYCRVCVLENNETRLKMIRLTMKLAEQQCENVSNLLRCHKSFLVNTDYIIRVTGNSRGYQLHLHHTEVKIPLSKNYCSETFLRNKP